MPHPNSINPKTGKRYNYVDPKKPPVDAARAELEELQQQQLIVSRQHAALTARDNLLTYTKYTMPDPEAPLDVSKSVYDAQPFHVAVAEALQRVEKGEVQQLIFCMPPRHGKTELATKRLAAWMSGRHPNWDLIVATYSDDKAWEFGSDTRNILTSPQHRQVFPNYALRRGSAAKDFMQTTGGGKILFKGRGGALTGSGGHCFVGSTVVQSKDGARQISALRLGDEVLSYEHGAVCWRRVQAVACRSGARIYRVTTAAGRVVEATPDHPFYVDGRWVEAGELTPGDRLLCAVRRDNDALGGRSDEAHGPRAQRVLLLDDVPRKGRELAAFWRTAVPAMRKRGAAQQGLRVSASRAEILFEGLLGRRFAGSLRAAGAGASEAVRALQRAVPAAKRQAALLLAAVRLTGPRGCRGRAPEPALGERRVGEPGAAPCHTAVSGATPASDQARRRQVSSLRSDDTTGGAPHRRKSTEQPRCKLGHGVSAVPRAGSLFAREDDTVVSVEDTGRRAIVYDIRVESAHCFFANGVLAHNCLLADDLFKDDQEAQSKTIRDQAWNWFVKVFMTRRMGPKLVILTMTRWHSDDIIGRLTDPENPAYNEQVAKRWKIIRFPAIAEDDDILGRKKGEALWPERYGLDYLEEQRGMDALGFEALFQQNPTVADGTLFRRENVRYYRTSPAAGGVAQLPEDLSIYAASDHAVGTDQRNDPTCMLKIGVDRYGNIYILDVFWQRVSTNIAVEAMLAMNSGNHPPLLWWAERGHITKSIGPFLSKAMEDAKNWINIREVTPATNKEQRAQAIAARFSQGKVYFPQGAWWVEKAISELMAFPNGIHDDFVDALAYIGLGLKSQVYASPPKVAPKEPAFGTLGWVKRQSQWDADEARRREAGGF